MRTPYPAKSDRRGMASLTVQKQLDAFYGPKCLLTDDTDFTDHHLNGDSSGRDFVHFVPLTLDLHKNLRRGCKCGNLVEVMRPRKLLESARQLYLAGETARAVGCARLAHAMQWYYIEPKDTDQSLSCATAALLYLRRWTGQEIRLSYQILQYLLVEISVALYTPRRPSPATILLLVEELASWLNERGHTERVVPCIEMIGMPRTLRRIDAEAQRSRILRQVSVARYLSGRDLSQVEEVLKQAWDLDQSKHNRYGITNNRVAALLGSGRWVEAFDAVAGQLLDGRPPTEHGIHFLYNLWPEEVGTSYATFAGAWGNYIVTAALNRHHTNRELGDYLMLLERWERKMKTHTKFIWPIGLQHRLLREAGGSNATVQRFLRDHAVPRIRSTHLVNSIEDILRLLVAWL